VVVGKVRQSNEANFGFNAETETCEDLVAAGVIDPTMVTRTALQNATSIAALLLTTEALVSEIKEEQKAPAMQLKCALRIETQNRIITGSSEIIRICCGF
jgi:chaperonin GroEL